MDKIVRDPSLSLREKWNAHIKQKKYQGVKPQARLVNRCAPWWYFVVAGGVGYWGITEVLPFLYHDRKVMLVLNQLFGMIILIEMAINWVCIRCVDSTYIPAIHGIKPPELLENEKVESIKPIHNGKLYKMFVATSLPDVNGNVERSAVPYWSWVSCVVCKRLRPPRCHHCVLCNKCVLKRDHHCYFAQACIGVNNLRHFVVFLFWAVIGCTWSWFTMLPYIFTELLPNMSYIDIVTPFAFVRFLLGYQDFLICFLTFLGWMITGFLVFTVIHFTDTVILVFKGVTSFEYDNNIALTDTRSKIEKIYSVFGHYWMLNFLFPCHMVFEPLENAVQWPNVNL